MTEETKETEKQKEEKSLQDLLDIQFKEDGSWIAKDTGNSPIMRKLNRKERRKRDALERKTK